MATFTNTSKTATTFTNNGRSGQTLWDDPIITWDSVQGYWDTGIVTATNTSKNTAIFTNLSKS